MTVSQSVIHSLLRSTPSAASQQQGTDERVRSMSAQYTSSVHHPPGSSLHPLQLLDEFLESFRERRKDNQSTDEAADGAEADVATGREKSLDQRRDEILRVADYLYGGSVLEAALAVLDTDGAIRQVRAQPSQRQAFLVRSASRNSGGNIPTYYFCLAASSKEGFLYCSCRSYFEKAKSDPKGLCKHLLALKLMPYLESKCKEETVPDADFSTILMRRMLPRDSA